MSVTSELASRYAKALYDLSKESQNQEKVFNELRAIEGIFSQNEFIDQFIENPLVNAEDKARSLAEALKDSGISEEVFNFVVLLAEKGRLAIFDFVVEAFQSFIDESHGVTRGQVRSASVLSPTDRKRIEEIVSKVTKKQVILTYKEDSQLIGGLVAKVGSYTFNDSLDSHLERIKEDLNRRAQ